MIGNADLHSLQWEGQNGKEEMTFEKWQQRTKMLLPKIIHGIKSSFTRKVRNEYEDFEFGWQKSFFDKIIRNDKQLEKTREYIINNPLKWELDVNNKDGENFKE